MIDLKFHLNLVTFSFFSNSPCEAVGGGVFPADFVSDWVVGVEVEELEEHFPIA